MSSAKGARGRRFATGLAEDAKEVNASVGFDHRLLEHDVAGSQAHARMLARHPGWKAADLKAAIKALAAPSFDRSGPRTRWGWIPNPADDG